MDGLIFRILVGIVTILVTLLIIALLDGKEVQSQVKETCMSAEERALVLRASLSGIDEGYKRHVSLLFEIWAKDPGQQPTRAKIGLLNGRSAYIVARRDAVLWTPPEC